MAILIFAVVYALIAVATYRFIASKWENSMFEKVWFSILWIVMVPLYAVHYIHNRGNGGHQE